MKLSLPDDLQKFVRRKMASGEYLTEAEVVLDALALMKQHDELRRFALTRLKEELAIGLEQIDRGEVVDGEAFFQSLRARNARRRRKSA